MNLEELIDFATKVLGYTLGGPFEGCMFNKNGRSVSPEEVCLEYERWKLVKNFQSPHFPG